MSGIISKFVSILLRPKAALEQLKGETEGSRMGPSIVFILIMGIIAGIISAISGMINSSQFVAQGLPSWIPVTFTVLVPFLSIILSFIFAFFIWTLVFGMLKSSLAQYKMTYMVVALLAAFQPIGALVSLIPVAGPWIGLVVQIYVTFLLILAIIKVLGAPPVRTWSILGTGFGLLFILAVVARVVGPISFPGQPPIGGDFGGLDGDFEFDDAELQKQLEELTREARENKDSE